MRWRNIKRRHPAGEADHHQIDAVSAGYGERRVREEEKIWATEWGAPHSILPVGEGKKQRSRNPGKPSATRGNLTSFEGDIDYERRGTPEILRTEGLSKFFPGVKALDNVNFSLRRGEIMALLGENGAGKSTLIKALDRRLPCRSRHYLAGRPGYFAQNTAHAQQLGIGTVYQEVNLLPNMSVADNLFIGREPRRFGLLRRKEMEARATALMASYGFSSTCASR